MALVPVGLRGVFDVSEFNKGKKDYDKSIDDVNKRTGGVAKRLTSALKGVATVATGMLAAEGVKAVGRAIGDMVSTATEVDKLSTTFDRLTASIGESGPAALKAMQDATAGMVTQQDLFTAGNRFFAMGLANSAEEAASLSQMAVTLGSAFGEEAGPAMENFALTLANQSIPRLDSFGISGAKVRERIEELQEATPGLSRETAFMTAVMEQGAIAMDRVGDITTTNAAKLTQIKTAFADVKVAIGSALLPVLNMLLTPLAALAQRLGPMIVSWAQRFEKVMSDLSARVTRFSDVIQNFFKYVRTGTSVFMPLYETLQKLGVAEELAGWIASLGGTIQFMFQLMSDGMNVFQAFGEAFTYEGGIGDFTYKLGQVSVVIANALTAMQTFGASLMSTITPAIEAARISIQGVFASLGAAGPGIFDTLLTMIPEAWRNVWETIFPQLSQTVMGLPQRIMEAFQTGGIGAAFGEVFSSALNIAGAITKVREGIVNGLFQLGQDLLQTLASTFPQLAPVIDTALLPILNVAQTLWETFNQLKAQAVEALLGMATGAAGALPPFQTVLATIAETLTSLATAAIPIFTQAFEFIVNTLIPAAMEVMQHLVPVIGHLGERIAEVASRAFPILISVLDTVVSNGVPALMAVLDALIPIVDSVIDVILNIAEDVLPVAIAVFEQVTGVIRDSMPAIQSIITSALDIIMTAWDLVWPTLQVAVESVMGIIVPLIEGALDTISGLFKTISAALHGDWSAAWEALKTTVLTLGKTLIDAVKNIFTGLVNVVKSLLGIGSDSTVMLEIADSIMGGLINGLFGWQIELVTSFTKIMIAGVDALKQLLPNFLQVGKDVIMGLAKGIVDTAKGYLKEKAEAIAGWLPGWIKEKLGIASASTVAMEAGKAFSEGLGLGVAQGQPMIEGPLGNVVGLFDQIINWLTGFATAIGGANLYDAAESMEDFADGVEDLSNAFVNIAEAVRKLKVGEITVEDIYTFLDTYQEFAEQAHQRMLAAYKAIGIKDLRRAQSAAKRLGATLNAISADLTTIKPGDLGQIDEYFNQMDFVLRRVHSMVETIARDVGPALLGTIADWAASLAKLFVLLKAPLKEIEPAEATGFKDRVVLYFDQLAFVMTTIGNWLGETTTNMLAQYKMAADVSEHAQAIFMMIKTGIDALTALADYEPVAGLDTKMTALKDNLSTVLSKLDDLAGDFELEGIQMSAKILQSAQQILGIVKAGIDALVTLADYEAVENVVQLMTAFTADIWEVLRSLNKLAADLADSGVESSAAILQSAQTMLGFVQPGIDALAAMVGYEPVQDIVQQMADFTADIWEVLRSLNKLATDLVDSGVESAATILQAAQTVLGFVKPGIDALAALANYATAFDLLDAIQNFSMDMYDLVDELAFLAGRFTDRGLDAAAQFSRDAQAILGLVVPGIDALDAIAEYRPARNLTQRVHDLRADLFVVVDDIDKLADAFADRGVSAAATFAGYAEKMLGLIQTGINAVQAVANYKPPKDVFNSIQALMLDLQTVIGELDSLGDSFADQGLSASAAIADTAGRMLGLIQPAIDAITAIAEYKPVQTITWQLTNFRIRLRAVISSLDAVAQFFADEGLPASAEILKAAQSMIGIVKPAIDAIISIAEYEPVQTITWQLTNFRIRLRAVISSLDAVAQFFADEGLPASAKILQAATTMVGLVKPGIDAITAIASYTVVGNIAAQARKLRADLKVVITELVTLSKQFQEEGISAAATFAGHANTIVGLVKPAIDAMVELATYKSVKKLKSKVKRFRRDLDKVLDELEDLAKDWEDEGLEEAAAFSEHVKGIIGLIKPAIDAITEITKYEGVKKLPSVLMQLEYDLDQVLWTIDRLAMRWMMAIPDAQYFLSAVGDIIALVQKTFDEIISLGTYRRGESERATEIVDTELRAVGDMVMEWTPYYQAVRAETRRLATIAKQIAGFTRQMIDALTGAFDDDEAVMGSMEDWPSAMEHAFDVVLEAFQDFGEDWTSDWLYIDSLLQAIGEKIIWLANAVDPRGNLVSSWEDGFDRMISKVRVLLGETAVTQGFSGIQSQLQWINDNVSNVANQFVSAFANMQAKTMELVERLDEVVLRVGAILQKTGGDDQGDPQDTTALDPAGYGTGLFADMVESVEDFINSFRPKKKTGGGGQYEFPINPEDITGPKVPIPPGAPVVVPGTDVSAFLSGRARYDPVMQGMTMRDVSINFQNVTINDTADLATFGAIIRREVRDAIGAP